MSDRSKLPPQTVRIEDAQARLAELATRALHGESFELTEHGQPVARLVPPEVPAASDPGRINEAAARLKSMHTLVGRATIEEIIAWKHEGHRF